MRPGPLALGLLVLAAAWLLPLPELLPGPFSAHMTRHIAVVAITAPLLALAIAGGKLDPVRRLRMNSAAIPASFLELMIVWSWHAPALHRIAQHTAWGLAAEQASFLASAFLVWLLCLGGEGRHGSSALGIVALLLTSMHMTLLGALLALAPRPLFSALVLPGALAPLDDQHLGGAIMLVVGGLSYLIGALYLAARLLEQPRARAQHGAAARIVPRHLADAATTEGDV